MTSSMGCGVWGGNITNENISLKHYMNVTWVSRPIPEDKPSEAELFGEFYNSAIFEPPGERHTDDDHGPTGRPARRRAETRIASYLLTEYLERLGVEVIFGLCGHTIIALLDALSKSRIRFITTPPRAGGRARGRRLRARVTESRASLLTPPRPGPDQCRDRRRQRRARLDSDGRDCRRHAVVLLRPPSAPGIQPAPGRRPVPDLPPVLQARLSRRPRRRSAAHHRARVPSGAVTAGPGPVLVDVPMDMFSADLPVDAFRQVPAEIARPALDPATAARIVQMPRDGASGR